MADYTGESTFGMDAFLMAHVGTCDGSETSYLDCDGVINQATNCGHTEDLGVVCGSMN